MNHSQFKSFQNYKMPKMTKDDEFDKIEEDKLRNRNRDKQSNAVLAMKGEYCKLSDVIDSKLGLMFFSDDNMRRLQRMIKKEVYEKTKKQFRLDEDQDESDLLIVMRKIFMEYAIHDTTRIVHQVKILNVMVINYIIPDIVTQLKQYYSYIKEINQPIKPMFRPMNVNNAGRRSLPALSTSFGF